ncbi:hypothetical protein ALC60_05815 [Trachymyrmex zeteki]|uniref:Uncharacterized protein n=1 Tax=Mycetomoellerius zeteki TaxID=64791 RepID=A0A151X4I6_9HYME|nr:hypothetical protein ALC60_05815 [Trachymyrmex zeteki]
MYLLKPYKRANVWINIAPYRAFFNCTYRIDIDYRVAERGTWLIHLNSQDTLERFRTIFLVGVRIER